MKFRSPSSTRCVFRLLLGMALFVGAGAASADHGSRDRYRQEPDVHSGRDWGGRYPSRPQSDDQDSHWEPQRAADAYRHGRDGYDEDRYHQGRRYEDDRYPNGRHPHDHDPRDDAYRDGRYHDEGHRDDRHRDDGYDERASSRHLRQLEEWRRQFDALPPQQQQRLRDTRDRFYQLPPEQRLRLREKWRELPREERRRWREPKHRHRD